MLTQGLLKQTSARVDASFDRLLLFGGAARMPQVAARLSDEFGVAPDFDPGRDRSGHRHWGGDVRRHAGQGQGPVPIETEPADSTESTTLSSRRSNSSRKRASSACDDWSDRDEVLWRVDRPQPTARNAPTDTL
jgi:hypothetical protein